MIARRLRPLIAGPALLAPLALAALAAPALAAVPYAPPQARPLPAALTRPLTCYTTFRDYGPTGKPTPYMTVPQATLTLSDNHYEATGTEINPMGAQAGSGYLSGRTYHFVDGPLNTTGFRVRGTYHAKGVKMPHSRLKRNRRFTLVITALNPHGKVSKDPDFSFAPFEKWYCGPGSGHAPTPATGTAT